MSSLYQRPGFLLRRAHQLSVGLFEHECQALKLTPPQFGVLHMLMHSEALDQASLARGLGLDKVTVLHVVRGLETRGWLNRQASVTDRRRWTLTLSDQGKAVFLHAQDLAHQASEQLLSPLDGDEQQQLIRLLEKLCQGLEAEARTPFDPRSVQDLFQGRFQAP
jgi:DNA-binding MarR family transcriptional regulator